MDYPKNCAAPTLYIHFGDLEKMAQEEGYSLRKCEHNHWQILDAPLLVHVWISMNKKTCTPRVKVFVEGMVRGYFVSSLEEIITACHTAPPIVKDIAAPRTDKDLEKIKWFLFTKFQDCRWCEKPLQYKRAKLGYKIPLNRSGQNTVYNMVLECEECNEWRRDGHMPELAARTHDSLDKSFADRLAREA